MYVSMYVCMYVCVYQCSDGSDKISAYIFTAVLAGFFSSLGLLRFYFHITIASDGASATNIEYLLLKLNMKTSNFIESKFRFL